jgi:hypothetical protein
VHQRFSRWAKSGVFERIFKLLASDHDNEYMMIDATIVRAHQHSAGARKKNGPQAIGRSRGGFRERLSGKRPLRVFQFLDLSGNFRLLEVLARNGPGALGAISARWRAKQSSALRIGFVCASSEGWCEGFIGSYLMSGKMPHILSADCRLA